MNYKSIKISALAALLALGFASCKDKDPIIAPGPSTGKTIQLQGIAEGEAGTSALNSVYIDFSTDEVKTVRRDGWDLGFYSGSKNRVIINNTSSATAVVTDKTNIADVSAADTIGVKTNFSMMDMSPTDMELIDNIAGDINKTVIPEVKATGNKVIIINRGTGNGIAVRDYYKIQLQLLANGNYKLTYAKLDATTTNTIEISKDAEYNFTLFSFDKGIVEKPKKKNWDIVWTATILKTMMGPDEVPYAYSDMVGINYLANTQVVEKVYDDEAQAAADYEKYSLADLPTESFSNDRWYIGSNWRKTVAPGSSTPAGTIKTKFYIIKDSDGNAYKLKFISFTAEDGGERGRPEIKYELLK